MRVFTVGHLENKYVMELTLSQGEVTSEAAVLEKKNSGTSALTSLQDS